MIYTAVMILTYVVVLTIVLTVLIKSLRIEAKLSKLEVGIKLLSRFSRFLAIVKVIKVTLMRPAVIIAIASLIIFTLISAQAVTAIPEVHNIGVCSANSPTLMIELSKEVNRVFIDDCLRKVFGVSSDCVSYYYIYRKLLNEPVDLGNLGRYYVVIVLPKKLLKKLVNIHCYVIKVCGGRTLVKNGLCCLSSEEILNLKLPTDTPLLPIQSYIGTKPVLPPPQTVIIFSNESLPKVIKELIRNSITDFVITIRCDYADSETINRIISNLLKSRLSNLIRSIWLCINGSKYVISKVYIPTLRSVTVALLTSIMASLMIIVSLTSLTPYLSKIYYRLSLVGLPTWTVPIISFILTSTMVAVVSISVIPYIVNVYGSVSVLNSLITLSTSWVTSTLYLMNRLKFKELRTDVYTPVTRRYSLLLKLPKSSVSIETIRDVIKKSIVTNEFFETEEFEAQVTDGELVIHSRVRYVECWGSGLDLNIIASIDGGKLRLHITSYVWSIEEISESVMNTMLSLAISRIIGGVKSWI